MAFGEPRLDAIDDVTGYLSSIRARVAIVAARQRMNLTERDVAEFEGLYEECDEIKRIVLRLRSQVQAEYLARIGH
jgi:hypothetical protein